MRPSSRLRATSRDHLLAVGFVTPALLVYCVFLVYPLLASLWGSVFDWEGTTRTGFIGLDNFGRLFTDRNLEFTLNAAGNNVAWFAGIMVVQNIAGLLLAYLLFLRGPRYRFFQSIFFFPAILSPVVVGALWRLLLAPSGPLNVVLNDMGIMDGTLTWLGDSSVALWTLIAIDVWSWVGLPILVFLAGLHSIDPSILESARLDGAGNAQVLIRVAVPLLLPAVSSLATLTVINTFNQFDIVYVMQGVQGNPARSTDVLVTYFYRLAFGSEGAVGLTDIGLALALGTLLFLFLVATTLMIIRYFNRKAAWL